MLQSTSFHRKWCESHMKISTANCTESEILKMLIDVGSTTEPDNTM